MESWSWWKYNAVPCIINFPSVFYGCFVGFVVLVPIFFTGACLVGTQMNFIGLVFHFAFLSLYMVILGGFEVLLCACFMYTHKCFLFIY